MTLYTHLESPIGPLLLTGNGQALTGLFTSLHRSGNLIQPGWVPDEASFTQAAEQLSEYFAGARREFDLPLDPDGTEFQHRVWEQLRQIPFGETRTYGQIAKVLGDPNASRAVGLANGRNPISIIVPCHRVIGVNQKLTGYAGGLEAKSWLLAHEQPRLAIS